MTAVTSRFRLTALAIGLGLAGVGCSSIDQDDTTRDADGAIVGEGELSAFSIKVGDCLGGDLSGVVSSAEGIPCTEPHQYEVYHSFELADGDGSFPGSTIVSEQAGEACYNAFGRFVGVAWEQSALEFWTLEPTEESWSAVNDREVLCLLGNPDGTVKTGSSEGSQA